MNLSFSTKWNDRMGELAGQPTFFVESIYTGLFAYDLADITLWNYIDEYYTLALNSGLKIKSIQDVNPKLHTIREDQHDRWKVGNKIHFIINPRTPNRFQFAPILEVKSIQRIEIEHYKIGEYYIYQDKDGVPYHGYIHNDGYTSVLIDEDYLNAGQIKQLAQNDGFNSVEDFFKWFNEDFSGKIISWTNFKY